MTDPLFLIKVPSSLAYVSEYIVRLVFEDFWGLKIKIESHDLDEYHLTFSEAEQKIILPALFITKERSVWMKKRERNKWGLKFLKYKDHPNFPVLFGGDYPTEDKYNIDFFGTIFFLLNRYHEKTEKIARDTHDRNKANQTFLLRNDLIYTPLSDIYVDEFGKLIEKNFGFRPTTKNVYQVLPSHDVDRPYEYLYYSKSKFIKRVSGDLLKRKSLENAKERIGTYFKVKRGKLDADPYNTFDWIMEQSEKFDHVSTFHFITEQTNRVYDQDYEISDPEIQNLIKGISERGHQIGLHPSYGSSVRQGQIAKEFRNLKQLAEDLGIEQDTWKNRNHFLRWNSDCLSELELAGIDVDQTLGFSWTPGFRCGTCRPFNPFNYRTNSRSSVLFEPLLVMEVSLFDEMYMGLENDIPAAWSVVETIKSECKRFGGNFTVLWHNNNFHTDKMKEFYTECIR